MGKKINNKN